jgi:hypothetical protein
VHGKLPRVGIGIEVEEAYLHCPVAVGEATGRAIQGAVSRRGC